MTKKHDDKFVFQKAKGGGGRERGGLVKARTFGMFSALFPKTRR